MNRINKKFKELKKKDQTALITYITAGDPSLERTEEIVYAKIEGGADIIELGIPFSDPLADGPIIQAAALRSLEAGTTPGKVISMVKKIRKNTEIPIVFLVYYNTVLSYGLEKFINDCEGLVDGLIIPDLSFEESDELLPYLKNKSVALIPMLAPTSQDRIEKILDNFQENGFVYCVTSLGVTGIDGKFHKDLLTYLSNVKKHSKIPVCAGFGVKSPEDFRSLAGSVDGVIIGSAIVKEINEKNLDLDEIKRFIGSFKE